MQRQKTVQFNSGHRDSSESIKANGWNAHVKTLHAFKGPTEGAIGHVKEDKPHRFLLLHPVTCHEFTTAIKATADRGVICAARCCCNHSTLSAHSFIRTVSDKHCAPAI